MDKYNLVFNNSHLGNIDEYVEGRLYNEKNKLIKIKLKIKNEESITLNIRKYKSPFTLIINEVKGLFSTIIRVNYHIATMDNIEYLLSPDYEHIPLYKYMEKHNPEKTVHMLAIRYAFIFNWLMCINSNYESKINVFSDFINYGVADVYNNSILFVQTFSEKSFSRNLSKYDISKFILNKYFDGSMEYFNKITQKFIESIDSNKIKFALERIVKKYDESYLWWVNIVYERLLSLK